MFRSGRRAVFWKPPPCPSERWITTDGMTPPLTTASGNQLYNISHVWNPRRAAGQQWTYWKQEWSLNVGTTSLTKCWKEPFSPLFPNRRSRRSACLNVAKKENVLLQQSVRLYISVVFTVERRQSLEVAELWNLSNGVKWKESPPGWWQIWLENKLISESYFVLTR